MDMERISSTGLCALQRASRAQGHDLALAAVESELKDRGQLRPKSAPAATSVTERARDWKEGVMDIHSAYASEVRKADLQKRASAALGRWGPTRLQRPSTADVTAAIELQPMDVE